jgi:SHS2 domain-containing protein
MGAGVGHDFELVEGATSDVAFEARGPTLEAAFAAAAEALLALTVEEPEGVRAAVRRRVDLVEPDRELLLLRFLNELVYLRDAEGLLLHPVSLRIGSADGEQRLHAELAGERIDRARHRLAADVKAATAHALRVAPTDGGWCVTATLDV